MENLLPWTATVFMGFFAIMNPIANTPIFVSLTSGDKDSTKKMIAAKAVSLAFGMVLVFCIAGKFIFEIFGITLPAFRITGGALVFLIGFHMLQGQHSSVQKAKDDSEDTDLEARLSVAISPLATPILAGPGTIATAMNYTAGGSPVHIGITVGVFGVMCFITYGFFVFGQKFVAYLGDEALRVITRMMGLILAVIGTQMLIHGIHGAMKLSF